MMNRVELIGRLTRKAELKSTQNGRSYVNFTLAVPRDKDHSDFISCSRWNKTAELISGYTNKGSLVGVEGKIQTRSYDNTNGTKTYVTEVLCDSVTFCDSKAKEEKEDVQPIEVEEPNILALDSEELPF